MHSAGPLLPALTKAMSAMAGALQELRLLQQQQFDGITVQLALFSTNLLDLWESAVRLGDVRDLYSLDLAVLPTASLALAVLRTPPTISGTCNVWGPQDSPGSSGSSWTFAKQQFIMVRRVMDAVQWLVKCAGIAAAPAMLGGRSVLPAFLKTPAGEGGTPNNPQPAGSSCGSDLLQLILVYLGAVVRAVHAEQHGMSPLPAGQAPGAFTAGQAALGTVAATDTAGVPPVPTENTASTGNDSGSGTGAAACAHGSLEAPTGRIAVPAYHDSLLGGIYLPEPQELAGLGSFGRVTTALGSCLSSLVAHQQANAWANISINTQTDTAIASLALLSTLLSAGQPAAISSVLCELMALMPDRSIVTFCLNIISRVLPEASQVGLSGGLQVPSIATEANIRVAILEAMKRQSGSLALVQPVLLLLAPAVLWAMKRQGEYDAQLLARAGSYSQLADQLMEVDAVPEIEQIFGKCLATLLIAGE